MNATMSLYCANGVTDPTEGQSWWNLTYAGNSERINPVNASGNKNKFEIFNRSDIFYSF